MLVHLKVPYYRALPLSSNVLALIGLCIDFPKGSGVNHAHSWKSVNIRGIEVNWKNLNVDLAQLSLIKYFLLCSIIFESIVLDIYLCFKIYFPI